jgi:uncharacterized protein YkwD
MGRPRGLGRSSGHFVLAASAALALSVSAACRPQPAAPSASRTTLAPATASPPSQDGERFEFPEATSSPLPLSAVATELAPFIDQCARGDGALSRVAERFARRQSRGEGPLDASELSFAVHAEGSPYLGPHAWTLRASQMPNDAVERLSAWLGTFGDGGERRCGVALVHGSGETVLCAVAIDALADLEPVTVRRPSGSWVEVDAHLLVEANAAKVIVLGPSGAPFAVPTTFDGRRARARFRADRPGAFLIQLLASVVGGPRPVLEATVYADVSPPSAYSVEPAPGEPATAQPADSDAAGALFGMINRAREQERLGRLERDPELDVIAERHAQAMRRLQRIAHDAGDGDPQSRLDAAQLHALAGENVAHALDATLAHRLLWASPSHRDNLLDPRFDRIGIGAVRDDDGTLWVCELFADFVN